MRTYLVAIAAHNQSDVMELLKSSPKWGTEEQAVDCWWIAEDDREDGSDHDSAVFVPRGAQSDVAQVIADWVEHHTEEWDEHGYPYAATDVSGAFYLPYEVRQRNAQEDRERAKAEAEAGIRRAAAAFLHGEDWSREDLERLARALGENPADVEALHYGATV